MDKGDVLRLAAATVFLRVLLRRRPMAGEVKKPAGVVELFTSQGCSSCPPADEIFGELARKGDVIALAYHVDYWDYLGWQDTLATQDNTARQYDYAKTFGARSVYTPQAVINGRTHVNGVEPCRHIVDARRFLQIGQGPHRRPQGDAGRRFGRDRCRRRRRPAERPDRARLLSIRPGR